METTSYTKYYGLIIATYCVYIALCSVIITYLMKIATADFALGKDYMDAGWYVGIAMSSSLGYGLSGLGIIFSIVSVANKGKQPEMIKGMGIAIFVFFMISMGGMLGGSISIGSGLADVVYCSHDLTETAAWRANCANDVIYDYVIIACMAIMAVVAIMGIIGSVKIVTIVSKAHPVGTKVRAQGITQAQGMPKFCTSCGAQNDNNAVFCKTCGKAIS
jgi:hypothetical protein